jgi:hypothetical protein
MTSKKRKKNGLHFSPTVFFAFSAFFCRRPPFPLLTLFPPSPLPSHSTTTGFCSASSPRTATRCWEAGFPGPSGCWRTTTYPRAPRACGSGVPLEVSFFLF